jgi:predicted glycosyltransferase
MGGYNSVGSALSFGVPTLIVPRTVPRREQLIRAQRLAALNLVDVMDPSQATATAIGEWMAHPPLNRPQARSVIGLSGLDRLTAIVSQLTPASKGSVHA